MTWPRRSPAVEPGGALARCSTPSGWRSSKLVAPLTRSWRAWAKWIAALKPEQIEGVVKIIERFGPALLAAAAGLTALVAPELLGQIPVLGGVLKNLTGPLKMVGGGLVKMGGSALAAIPGLGSMGPARPGSCPPR